RHVARLLRELDRVADLYLVARNRHALAVDLHVTVGDELARRERCGHELRAIDDGVEPALEQAHHVLAGVALAARGFLVVAPELPLGDVAVIALQLLFRLKLRAVIRELLRAPLTVLARTVGAFVDGAFRATPNALTHATVELVFGIRALAHRSPSWSG